MSERESLWQSLITHWGQAIIVGLFAFLTGGAAVRVQSAPELEAGAKASALVRDLENRLAAANEENQRKDEQLRTALGEVAQMRNGTAKHASRTLPEMPETVAPASSPVKPPAQTHVPTDAPASGPVKPPVQTFVPTERLSKGDFQFELGACRRFSDDVRCSLAVTYTGSDKRNNSAGLCGSYLLDLSGNKPTSKLADRNGMCAAMGMETGLRYAFTISAEMPDVEAVMVVLHEDFTGSVVFRNVQVQK
jgi:hypothetical protein